MPIKISLSNGQAIIDSLNKSLGTNLSKWKSYANQFNAKGSIKVGTDVYDVYFVIVENGIDPTYCCVDVSDTIKASSLDDEKIYNEVEGIVNNTSTIPGSKIDITPYVHTRPHMVIKVEYDGLDSNCTDYTIYGILYHLALDIDRCSKAAYRYLDKISSNSIDNTTSSGCECGQEVVDINSKSWQHSKWCPKYKSLSMSYTSIKLYKTAMYVPVKDLPDTMKAALRELGVNLKDIEMIASEETNIANQSYGDGYRGFVCLLNILTGEKKTFYGSFGGQNMFEKTIVDDGDKHFKILPNMAVIKGQQGGIGATRATIYVAPETLTPLLPQQESITERDKRILYVFKGYTSAYRKEVLSRNRVRMDELEKLIAGGYLNKNKAGSISITTKGKNAIGNDRFNEYDEWPQ